MSSGINATRYTAPKGGNQPAQGGTQGGHPEVWIRGKDGKLVKQ
jgi:hypothetical protein